MQPVSGAAADFACIWSMFIHTCRSQDEDAEQLCLERFHRYRAIQHLKMAKDTVSWGYPVPAYVLYGLKI